MASSWSLYSCLPPKPPPVAKRQAASASSSGNRLRLSKHTSQEFLAAATRSRTSRGTPLSAEVRGSIRELITRHPVDLPAPCSPLATRMGHGRPGRRAATRKARIKVQPSSSTLKKGRNSSRLPPRSGSGSGCEPRVRRNFAAGRSTTRQPWESISTARQERSHSSR